MSHLRLIIALQGLGGYVIVIDPKGSVIATKLGITLPGRYALKVR